jgi:hypothetical protein
MADRTIHLQPGVNPGTHALVIGVGRYPHLLGGDSPTANPDGMRQLSSPPVSARAFATWLLSEYRPPRVPLASLSLLLSEEASTPFQNPVTGSLHDIEVATIGNIVEAVKEWKTRGDSHDDNRLIFYFCGHGVSQGDDMSLLAADMFADEFNPLNNALDLRKLMSGLKRCRASEQVFFVDACRASSDVLIEQAGQDAGQAPLGSGNRPPEFKRRLPATYYATLAGDKSHGRPGEVSLFTSAVLKGLRGSGSDNPEGQWWVSTIRLLDAIDHFMKQPLFAGTVAGVQVPTVSEMPGFILHELPADPVVPVYVGCAAGENQQAEFICRSDGLERQRRALADVDAADPDREWALELEFGDYEFEAQLGNQVRTKEVAVRPVYQRVKLVAP